jgi:hypothetical protein
VAEWPAAIVPPRHAKNAAAAHNRLMAMAYGGGADAYIAASAEGLLHPDAIVALMRAVRASGRRALAAAKRLPNPGRGLADPDALDAEWLCGCGLAIPKAVYAAIGGFDEDFAANGADIDFSWRARLQGFDLLNCPPATFLDRADREDPAEALIAGYRLARKWGRRNAAAKLARALDRRALPVPADVSDTTPRSGDPAVADFVFAKVARVRPW